MIGPSVRNHVSKTVQTELNKHISSHAQPDNGIESAYHKITLPNVSNSNLHIKRDYKLTKSSDFDYFFDYLRSELRSNNLLYVVDKDVKPLYDKNEKIKEIDKFKVRDAILNRIDNIYYKRISKLVEPESIMKKLKEIKTIESNLTSGVIRKQLYTLMYQPGKEKASEFCNRFEELVHTFESLLNTTSLPEEKRCDAFYNAISKSAESVKHVQWL